MADREPQHDEKCCMESGQPGPDPDCPGHYGWKPNGQGGLVLDWAGHPWPAPPDEPLRYDGTRCDTDMPGCDEGCCGACGPVPCGESSRFQVERSDRDPSYRVSSERGPTEACEAHLADTVAGLMDGNDKIAATVRLRWN